VSGPVSSTVGDLENSKPPGGAARSRATVFRVTLKGSSAADPDAKWVEAVRLLALVVFPGLIVFSVLRPALAGRVVWTIAIASLPLFFVLAGYHRWRRICPLAFMSQIPAMVGLAGSRRAGPWLRDHGYRLAFAIFIVSLWLRLIATNGDGYALAIFLGGISLAAFVTGLVFTGKTWCNYVCPVFFVEKLYTEPRGLRDTPNSQCQVCTACRPSCPDINEENSYWKDILLPDKRHVFYAFPGVVLAFYVYYFLQAGTWEYYFGGRWTREVGLFHTAFRRGTDAATAGLYFWPSMPRAIAAAATLAIGAVISLTLFSLAERPIGLLVRRRDHMTDATHERHVMFSLAAFTAFVGFYSFAGAPTLRLVSGAPHFFQLLVVTTSTLFLVRRLGRRQRDFAEETLARTFIARWPWTDSAPPKDLHEAFLIYNVRSKASGEDARAGVLDLYKIAVRETVNAGVTSRTDVQQFDSLRSRLRITEADHERIMSELAEEDTALQSAGVAHASPEKQLQLDGYAAALAAGLDVQSSTGRGMEDALIRRLRDDYAVTADEHRLVLDRLVRQREGIAAHVFDAPLAIEQTAAAIRALDASQSPVTAFLSRLLKRRWTRTVDTLLQAVAGGDEKTAALRNDLLTADSARRLAALAGLGTRLSPGMADRLKNAVAQAASTTTPDELTMLGTQLSSADPYIRATAFYILQSKGEAPGRDALAKDDHPLVHETVVQAQRIAEEHTDAEPSTLEKMIALCSAPLFESLEPEDLVRLARQSTQAWFTKGEVLCREGEVGDEAFLVLAGEVSIFRRDGAIDRPFGVEGPGTCIGELSVLDPAPRASTVVVSSVAVRALRVSGQALRDARDASPAVSDGIIRLLVRRLRRVGVGATPTAASPPES
jgi:hypothetical protein